MEVSDRAYSSLALKAHNDSIYLKNGAGYVIYYFMLNRKYIISMFNIKKRIEIFHMIKKAKEGGDSLMIVNCYLFISKSSNSLSVFV